MFLLPASRGDIDISTDDLMVLVEVPPIYLIVQYEYHREHCNCLKTSSEVRKYFGENVSVQESCPLKSLHPARECSHAFVNISLNSFSCSDCLTVFTDKKPEFAVPSLFCAMQSGVLVSEW